MMMSLLNLLVGWVRLAGEWRMIIAIHHGHPFNINPAVEVDDRGFCNVLLARLRCKCNL